MHWSRQKPCETTGQNCIIWFGMINISPETAGSSSASGSLGAQNDQKCFSLNRKGEAAVLYVEQRAETWIIKLSCELITPSKRPRRSQEAMQTLRKMTLISRFFFTCFHFVQWSLSVSWTAFRTVSYIQSSLPIWSWFCRCAMTCGMVTLQMCTWSKWTLLQRLQGNDTKNTKY